MAYYDITTYTAEFNILWEQQQQLLYCPCDIVISCPKGVVPWYSILIINTDSVFCHWAPDYQRDDPVPETQLNVII